MRAGEYKVVNLISPVPISRPSERTSCPLKRNTQKQNNGSEYIDISRYPVIKLIGT
jgi:hypothetical protein